MSSLYTFTVTVTLPVFITWPSLTTCTVITEVPSLIPVTDNPLAASTVTVSVVAEVTFKVSLASSVIPVIVPVVVPPNDNVGAFKLELISATVADSYAFIALSNSSLAEFNSEEVDSALFNTVSALVLAEVNVASDPSIWFPAALPFSFSSYCCCYWCYFIF